MRSFDRAWQDEQPNLFQKPSNIVLTLQSRWEELLGSLAGHCHPKRLHGGRLTILVDPPDYLGAVEQAAPTLRDRLGVLYPRILIREIVVKHGAWEAPQIEQSQQVPVQDGPTPPAEVLAEIEATLEGENGPLKERFRSMMLRQWQEEAASGQGTLGLKEHSSTTPPVANASASETLDGPAARKLNQLRETLQALERVVVAYSGGVDSALLAFVASQELGAGSLAVIGVSPSLPKSEHAEAIALGERFGFPVRAISTNELAREGYVANEGNRCYHCRVELYSLLAQAAQDHGGASIVDGYNASDVGDHRPGRIAAQEHNVRSPLHEVGLDKEEIRSISKALGLPTWSKPAAACLSSRIPVGTKVTPSRLAMVEAAEEALKALGLAHCRVRHHETIARIEVAPEDMLRLVEEPLRQSIVEGVKAAGYAHVVLDLEGYRPGGGVAE